MAEEKETKKDWKWIEVGGKRTEKIIERRETAH